MGDQSVINYYNNNFPDWNWGEAYNYIAWVGLTDTTQGQNLDIENDTNFNYYNTEILTNSTKNQNCN